MKFSRYFILLFCIICAVPFLVHATFDQNLKYGSKGSAVVELQNFLIAQKYLLSEATGNFYNLTKQAVINFQKAYNIDPSSGYFGPITRGVANTVALQAPAQLALGTFPAPTGVTTSVKSCNEVWLTWVLPALPAGASPVTKIDIYRNGVNITSIDATYGTFVDKSLKGNSLQYAVVAINALGNRSNMSAGANAEMSSCPADPTTTPTTPSALSVQYISDSALKLTWADNSTNEIGFEMERSVNGGAYTSAGKLQPNLTTVTDTGVAPGILFSYRIKALGLNGGVSSYSNEASYKIGSTIQQGGTAKLAVFDMVFTTPLYRTYGYPVYWNGLAPWSHADGTYMSKEDMQKVALIGKNGGTSIHNNFPIPPNTFTVIDVENVALETMSTADMVQRFKWMREVAPNLRIGLYAWVGQVQTHNNYDDIVQKTARYYARKKENEDVYRPLIPYLDSFTPTIYMLGPGAVDRDLAAFKQVALDWKEAFPNVPFVPFVWGSYHDSWNPPHSIIPDNVLRRYVQVMREYFDGVIVWGPEQDNKDLVRIMKEEGALIKPAGYKKLWTADFAPK